MWVHPAHAQGDFLTLEDNVDPSGTELMCPTRPSNYVDCADVGPLPGVPSGTSASGTWPRRLSAHRGRERHRHREASGHAWHERLYLRARGGRQRHAGKDDHAHHGHSRRHSHLLEYQEP
jgi:hypothetical protein